MELNLDSIVASFAQNNFGPYTLEENRGREKALAALGVYFAVRAAIFAAAVEFPVAASVGVADYCHQGSLMVPALLSVLVYHNL